MLILQILMDFIIYLVSLLNVNYDEAFYPSGIRALVGNGGLIEPCGWLMQMVLSYLLLS